jgi:hypothetical protein
LSDYDAGEKCRSNYDAIFACYFSKRSENDAMLSYLKCAVALLVLASPALGVWNEGYFLVEQRYVQTTADQVAPESSTNTALRFTIRTTAPTQTALVTKTNIGGSVITVDPIGSGILVGAHYNKLFFFDGFSALTNAFPPGSYSLDLLRTYSDSTQVRLRPDYEFDGVPALPSQAPIITNGVWSNGVMVLTNTTLNIEWQPWTSPNSNSAIAIEITRRGGGGAGGGIRSAYNSPITWSGLATNAVYDCELQFMNVVSKQSLSDPKQGDGQEFRVVQATTTRFTVVTGLSTNSTTPTNPPVTGTNGTTKRLISEHRPFNPDIWKDQASNRMYLAWFAEDRLKYRVQTATDLGSTNWTNFGGEMTGGGFDTTIYFTPTNQQVFYRIVRSGDHVIEAKYGAESTFRDVTSFVTSLHQSSTNGFTVGNHTLGGDPIFGKVKTLFVTISKADGTYEYSGREGTTLDLRR